MKYEKMNWQNAQKKAVSSLFIWLTSYMSARIGLNTLDLCNNLSIT